MAEILTLVGSLRTESVNSKFAQVAAASAPEGAAVTTFEGLEEIPFYNEDLDVEGKVPAKAAELRAAVAAADGLLLVTPEYNGTMPAVINNAIDWISRPFGASSATGTKAAVIGTSAGQYGGVWAHDDVRKSLKVAGAEVVEDATLAIGASYSRFAEVEPQDDAEVVEGIAKVVAALAGTTGATAPAELAEAAAR
ncbi:FMN reductase [Sinomonas atrocyanea]|uniref:FMN reductase n=1 Tax=Sinomonas atrocyanea TaxID=37927 RepID=A0A127A6A8_9MICC|nr:NADPH-dependent FMN reductase [Sinomonas atrocyanea]AMM34314.1 FMN reductase [Sinomonas atrocyanea]GEB66399.1 FMN reductase [Sinomonas atrocyanea]GGG63605.1 FMN reductase [Sinomonas atrocyanea]